MREEFDDVDDADPFVVVVVVVVVAESVSRPKSRALGISGKANPPIRCH